LNIRGYFHLGSQIHVAVSKILLAVSRIIDEHMPVREKQIATIAQIGKEKSSDLDSCISTLAVAYLGALIYSLFDFCWSVRPFHDTVSDCTFPSVVEAHRSHNLGSAITLALEPHST
jgi:hypothetical protein